MKKKHFLSNLILISVLILGCNNDENLIPIPKNQKPGGFIVQVTQITEHNALLMWN